MTEIGGSEDEEGNWGLEKGGMERRIEFLKKKLREDMGWEVKSWERKVVRVRNRGVSELLTLGLSSWVGNMER